MPAESAHVRANIKYRDKNYDQISMVFPKGTRDQWKNYAAQEGKSLQAFVREAVEAKAEIDGLEKISPQIKKEQS